MIKYLYVEALCPASGYRSLMPVEYEKKDGEYHKIRCSCYIEGVDSPCKQCKHLIVAPEIPPENSNLRDTLLKANR